MNSLISTIAVGIIPYLLEDTTIEDILKTVEALHRQNDFAGAKKFLEEHQSDVDPGVWHFNLGVLNAKLDQWALARFHFLKSEELGYSNSELLNNQKIVEEKLDLQKLEKPISTADYLVKGAMIGSQGIFLSISFLFLILSIISLWKKAGTKIFAVFISLAISITGLNFWILSWDKYVVINPAPVFEGPSVIFQNRGEIPSGVLIIVEKQGDWERIIFPSRFEGWIKAVELKEL